MTTIPWVAWASTLARGESDLGPHGQGYLPMPPSRCENAQSILRLAQDPSPLGLGGLTSGFGRMSRRIRQAALDLLARTCNNTVVATVRIPILVPESPANQALPRRVLASIAIARAPFGSILLKWATGVSYLPMRRKK